MSPYIILKNEASTRRVTSRQLKICLVLSVSILLAFALFYKGAQTGRYFQMENGLFQLPLYSNQPSLSPIVPAVAERYIVAPVTLDPKNPYFSFTYTVRRNIERVLEENVTDSNVKPFMNIYEHFKLSPALKIAGCENPKAMSTVMMNLMCYLYDEENFLAKGNNIPTTWWTYSACRRRNDVSSYGDVVKNMPYGANIMNIIREPFSRFVSAYLNKCVVEVGQNVFDGCFNCTSAEHPNCIIERLYDILTTQNFNKEVNNKDPFHYETYHFAPQTWVCRMKDMYKSAVFIRYGDYGAGKAEMYASLVAALTAFKVPQRKVDYVERAFENQGKTGHSTRSMDVRDKLIDDILTNRTLYDMLMDIYKHDYDIFEFTPPSFRNTRHSRNVEARATAENDSS